MSTSFCLYTSVPLASFRVAQAREYWETYPCPPPATVYGMLLSLVGETQREAHIGAEVAIGRIFPHEQQHFDVSVVLRKTWRIKKSKVPLGIGENARPEFQELLSHVKLAIWVRSTQEETKETLTQRLQNAFTNPSSVRRFGGLSLGESTHMVDEIRPWRDTDIASGDLLIQQDIGQLSLPVWVDHVGSKETKWKQFSLEPQSIDGNLSNDSLAWTRISPS